MGTYAFVWTSRIWIRPLPDFGGHLAGAGAPERPFLPELHEQMWHEPRYQHSCRILSKYRIMGYQSNRPIKGIPKLDHFQTLPIHKCTMCDFPNFSAMSNNSWFSSISGVFSALGAHRKVVDTVLESSTREDQVYDVRFPKFFSKVK